MLNHLINRVKQDIVDMNLSLDSNDYGMPYEFYVFKKYQSLTIIDLEYVVFQTIDYSINKDGIRISKNDIIMVNAHISVPDRVFVYGDSQMY